MRGHVTGPVRLIDYGVGLIFVGLGALILAGGIALIRAAWLFTLC